MFLRPITFVLAIVVAVLVGNRSDSFWYGLLGFFVAMGAGRVIGALVRGRTDRAYTHERPCPHCGHSDSGHAVMVEGGGLYLYTD